MIYQDPILKRYIALFKAAMPDVFKTFYQGDPILIPKSNVPALVVSKTRTRVGAHSNEEDEHEIGVVLSVIVDIRDQLNDDKSVAAGVAQLYEIIEGRDDATLALKSKTILDVLRSNVVVDSALNLRTDLGTITTADYGMTIGKRDKEAYAIEGQVEFIASFTQVR
jgi:hypothetical protein